MTTTYNNNVKMAIDKYRVTEKGKRAFNRYQHSAKGLYQVYKNNAKKEFALAVDDFKSWYNNTNCTYCGDHIDTIGIDRVDSSKGYTKENIVPCCTYCNVMKLDFPRDKFLNHIHKIALHNHFI